MTPAVEPEFEMRLRLVWRGALVMGPGRADLLAGIAARGSIAAAGRAMGMSYKRAWALVEAMNETFSAPVVLAAKGGAGGGGAQLTPLGERVLAAYRQVQAAAAAAGAPGLHELQAALAVPPLAKDL
jgi:molybdate transport system regulatory protein